MRLFFARYRSASSFKRFVPKMVTISRKTNQFCHCEEGACARRGNLKRSETASRNELWLSGTKQNLGMNRTLKERGSETKQRISCFFVIGLPSCFLLPCFATGCHTFGLKIATAALRPRNDTKSGRFLFAERKTPDSCLKQLPGV